MLPNDAKSRKEAANSTKVQSTLDAHVEVVDPETIVRYSDAIFQEAAEDWLISTDQVSCHWISLAVI